MKISIVILLLEILIMAKPVKASQSPIAQPTTRAVIASNLFSLDLYSKLSHDGGNICVSPFSVNLVLGMTASGGSGATADQMLSVLHWTGISAELPAATAALSNAIVKPVTGTPDHDPQISVANAIFGQQGNAYKPAFVDQLANQYQADLQTVDFATRPLQACEHINQWAAEKTHDRIKQAVPASAINAQTRMVLVDAIYFKSAWENAFNKFRTQDQAFFQSHTESISVPTMQQTKSLRYMEDDTLQMAEFPYTGDFSLLILLPRQQDGLPAIEKSLTGRLFDSRVNQLSPQLLQVYLPRFKMEGEYQLTDVLRKLGMVDAFDAQKADFSGILSHGKVCIDQVIHKTFISVDEEGTEAAAVTAVTMRATAMRPRSPEPKPIDFRANHPFMFVLRHRSTGSILFIGRVTNPL